MPAKKKVRKVKVEGAVAGGVAGGPAVPENASVNAAYHAVVSKALNAVMAKWPDISTADPLTLVQGGFVAPFNPEVYDAKNGPDLDLTCGINLLWVNALLSITPAVPMSLKRVQEFADQLDVDTILTPVLEVSADFDTAASMPKGSLVRISPDEVCTRVSSKSCVNCHAQ